MLLYSLPFLLLCILIITSNISPWGTCTLITDTWSKLQWRQVVVLHDRTNWDTSIITIASKQGISVSQLLVSEYKTLLDPPVNTTRGHGREQFITILDNSRLSSTADILEMVLLLSGHVYPYHVLIVTDRQSDLINLLQKVNTLLGMYIIDLQSGAVFQLITMLNQNKVAQNALKPDRSEEYFLTESYDLQGGYITSYTLPYMPSLDINECDDNNRNCATVGVVADIMDVLGKTYNFTTKVHLAEEWGAVPAYGGYGNGDAVFVGALGAVVNGTCEIGLSFWVVTADRTSYVDMPLSLSHQLTATMINKAVPHLDITLFLRPFTANSWFLIFVIVLLVPTFILLPPWKKIVSQTSQKVQHTLLSYRVVIISFWIFFILINAYYGGALTMFFSSAPSPPFTSVRDALTRYPKWKMILPDSQRVLVDYEATELKDPPYVEFYERAHQPNQEAILSLSEAVMMLKKPDYFVYSIVQPLLIEYDRSKPSGVELQLVTKEPGLAGSLILNKRSPLTKMFNKGILKLRQTGIMEMINKKWEIELLGTRDNGLSAAEALAGGQASLVFILLCLSTLTALLVLIFECCWAKLDKNNTVNKEPLASWHSIMIKNPL